MALHDFIDDSIDEVDLTNNILPTMEKSLLRSPEVSLTGRLRSLFTCEELDADAFSIVIADFFTAYSQTLDSTIFRRILTATVNSTKSSNLTVRTGAVQLFKTIITKTSDSADLKLALDELLTLPRTGKTAGADHRLALYTMLGHLPTSLDVSPAVSEGPTLLAKETHDGCITVLSVSLAKHIVFCLSENIALPSAALTSITKEMNSLKPPLRRAFSSLVGNVLWQLGDLKTQASLDFAKAVLPSLENSLKTVAASPAAPPAGPLEGYIAVALLLGPYNKSGKFGRSIVFLRAKRFSEAVCTCAFVLILQRTRLIEMRLSSHCSQVAQSRPSCCGKESIKSSLKPTIKYGFFVLAKPYCHFTRLRS